MNKILISGFFVFVSTVAFYAFSKDNMTQSTISNKSASELKYQVKNRIFKKNEMTRKASEVSLSKDPIQEGLAQMKKQARLDDDEKFLDKDKLVLSETAILDRMTEDERAEYYKEKELNHVVGNEIANNNSAIQISYNEAILSRMTEDETNEYYDEKELKNMNILEIDNNYAVDIPYEALNPTE